MQGLEEEALRAKALEAQVLELTHLLPTAVAQENEPSGPSTEPRASSIADDIRQARQQAMDAQVAIVVAHEELRQEDVIRASCSADDFPQARANACGTELALALGDGECKLERSPMPTAMGKPHPRTVIQVTLMGGPQAPKVRHQRPRPPPPLQESHHCSCCGMAPPLKLQGQIIFFLTFHRTMLW